MSNLLGLVSNSELSLLSDFPLVDSMTISAVSFNYATTAYAPKQTFRRKGAGHFPTH